MSIATAITNAQNKVAAAYTAVSNKGGTLPVTQDLSNLPTAISSISATKYGIDIDAILGVVNNNGAIGFPTGSYNFVGTGIQRFSAGNVFSYRFYRLPTILTASFPDLITTNYNYVLYRAFGGCPNFTTASFPELTTASSAYSFYECFYACPLLSSVSFPKLKTVGTGNYVFANCFNTCTSLTTVTFPVLDAITGQYDFQNAFKGCTALTSLSFPALKSTSFGSYTNQFNSMLDGVTGCTVHFPSNLQSVIGSWASVTAGFSGTNTSVLFDLTATE